ncbi:MAG: hypothetical protein P4M11_12190 [Candidatus Pacebacteria bacterium]|nr:hypothetical protein [Candidatus Paceibacterota bacterium]
MRGCRKLLYLIAIVALLMTATSLAKKKAKRKNVTKRPARFTPVPSSIDIMVGAVLRRLSGDSD